LAGRTRGKYVVRYRVRTNQNNALFDQNAPRNYNVVMKTRIVKIGNSLGVRIPKVLLEQSRLAEEVEIEAFDRQIVIRAARQPRDDWDAAFQAMAENGDDKLLDAEAKNLNGWDETEWQW